MSRTPRLRSSASTPRPESRWVGGLHPDAEHVPDAVQVDADGRQHRTEWSPVKVRLSLQSHGCHTLIMAALRT